jgi:hypothetical protein
VSSKSGAEAEPWGGLAAALDARLVSAIRRNRLREQRHVERPPY